MNVNPSKRLFFIMLSLVFFMGGPAFSMGLVCEFLFLKDQIETDPFRKPDIPPSSMRRKEDIKELRIGTYNFLNMFIPGVGEMSAKSDKPYWALREIAGIIQSENYDILVAQELMSYDSALQFNKRFLKDEYLIFSTAPQKANEERSVKAHHSVFFVKKDLPFTYQLEGHRAEMWRDPLTKSNQRVFMRDLPTLHIYESSKSYPFLTLIGVHLKSKMEKDKKKKWFKDMFGEYKEYDSDLLRKAQADHLVGIVQRYEMKFGYDHPIVVAGDFNGKHNFSPEFESLYRYGHLVDSLGINNGVRSYADRSTHDYFEKKRVVYQQIDGILVVGKIQDMVKDSYVVSYRNNGESRPLPRNHREKAENPSDHRAITTIFNIENLFLD